MGKLYRYNGKLTRIRVNFTGIRVSFTGIRVNFTGILLKQHFGGAKANVFLCALVLLLVARCLWLGTNTGDLTVAHSSIHLQLLFMCDNNYDPLLSPYTQGWMSCT